jgi:hypothetical protein
MNQPVVKMTRINPFRRIKIPTQPWNGNLFRELSCMAIELIFYPSGTCR